MKNLIAATLAALILLAVQAATTGSPTPPNDAGTARSQALTAYELGHHGDHHYPRHLRVKLRSR